MPELALNDVVAALRAAPAWQRKHEISVLSEGLLHNAPVIDGKAVLLGDDAAAIETPDGYLLMAAEIMYPPLVKAVPYLAGKYAVLTNANDIYAMGGYPVALVDVVLSEGTEGATEILKGLRDGCARYGVALIGGHLTAAGEFTSVAAAILGRAKRILSGFGARPGDRLLHATNLKGSFHPRFTFWECSSHLSDGELRRDLSILPELAEAGLCDACRDVSMAGILGSAIMLLEPSGVGAAIDLRSVPVPPAASGRFMDWLLAFPSYGFILSVRPQQVEDVRAAFARYEITCADVGEVTTSRQVTLRDGGEETLLWDLDSESFTGFSPHPSGNGISVRR